MNGVCVEKYNGVEIFFDSKDSVFRCKVGDNWYMDKRYEYVRFYIDYCEKMGSFIGLEICNDPSFGDTGVYVVIAFDSSNGWKVRDCEGNEFFIDLGLREYILYNEGSKEIIDEVIALDKELESHVSRIRDKRSELLSKLDTVSVHDYFYNRNDG